MALFFLSRNKETVFMCEFYDMLREFNKNNFKWRKIWGREDAKDKDLETLLRFCALKKYVECKGITNKNKVDFEIEGYYESYAEMLDSFSKEAMGFRKNDIEAYRKSLENFLDLFEINTVLKTKVALMEGFYVIYEKIGIKKKITKLLLDHVQDTNGYKNNSGQRTVNIKKMNGRWNAVYEVWNGTAE